MNKQRDEMRLTDGARATLVSMHRFSHALRPIEWDHPPSPTSTSITKLQILHSSPVILPPHGDIMCMYACYICNRENSIRPLSTLAIRVFSVSFRTYVKASSNYLIECGALSGFRRKKVKDVWSARGDSYLLLYSDTKETPTSFSTATPRRVWQ